MVKVRTTMEPDKTYEVSEREAAEMQNRGYLAERVEAVDPSTVTNVDAKEAHDEEQDRRLAELEQDGQEHKGRGRGRAKAEDKE